jgi:hypothetical protein
VIELANGALDSQPDLEPPYPDELFPEPASAIRLARERNIPTILPAAFYHLSRLSIENDWGRADMQSEGVKNGCAAEWSLLTADDLRCLLTGQAKLSRAPREILNFRHDGEECPEVCFAEKRQELLMEIQEACIKSQDVLRVTRHYIEKKSYKDGICHLCTSRIRHDLATFRCMLLTLLPDFFSSQ